MSQVRSISVEQAQRELKGGACVLVDVREEDELRKEGFIAGAIHVPRGVIHLAADPGSAHHVEELDPEAAVLVYCAAGVRSALAGAVLVSMGFKNVANVEGGIRAWRAAGLPVERIA